MSFDNSTNPNDRLSNFWALTFGVLVAIAAIYWPLHQAGLVWVDKICFSNKGWLRYGDGWRHFMFHGFYDWTNYFRPLVIALFTGEVRLFDGSPGQIHLVSLGIHLANTLLVGVLAGKLSGADGTRARNILVAGAMLIYGLHPASIEPVAWISCQFELAVTFFMLLGLIAHLSALSRPARAALVSVFFFLAACSKESAISMPVLLILADLTRSSNAREQTTLADALRTIRRNQWVTYFLVLATGVAYLILRHWALGFLVSPSAHESLSTIARVQTICFVYDTYLRMIVWPMTGLGPIHIVDAQQFASFGFGLLLTDVVAIVVLAAGIGLACRRKAAGFLVLAATAALFPALHVIPVAFDPSLYHDRYAMTAIAMICAWMPGVYDEFSALFPSRRKTLIVASAASVWLVLAVANIWITLPLWSDELLLWQWVLLDHPDSIVAKDHLLSTYIERDDYPHARALADRIVASGDNCPNCLLNAAYLALADNDLRRAESALGKLQQSPSLADDRTLYAGYVLATGQLFELQHDFVDSEKAYRGAISMDSYDPQPYMQLALLLAHEGKPDAAKVVANKAFMLLPPDQRIARSNDFNRALAHPAARSDSPWR